MASNDGGSMPEIIFGMVSNVGNSRPGSTLWWLCQLVFCKKGNMAIHLWRHADFRHVCGNQGAEEFSCHAHGYRAFDNHSDSVPRILRNGLDCSFNERRVNGFIVFEKGRNRYEKGIGVGQVRGMGSAADRR